MTSLSNFALESNLTQLVNFKTWSRVINGTKKESQMDHIYTNNILLVCNVHFEVPTFGDLANLSFNESPTDGVYTRKRSWKLYSSNEIKTRMEQINFDVLNEISVNIGVQEHWIC